MYIFTILLTKNELKLVDKIERFGIATIDFSTKSNFKIWKAVQTLRKFNQVVYHTNPLCDFSSWILSFGNTFCTVMFHMVLYWFIAVESGKNKPDLKFSPILRSQKKLNFW